MPCFQNRRRHRKAQFVGLAECCDLRLYLLGAEEERCLTVVTARPILLPSKYIRHSLLPRPLLRSRPRRSVSSATRCARGLFIFHRLFQAPGAKINAVCIAATVYP
jgi:hypothetical protein